MFAEQVANFAQRTERRLARTVSGAATKLATNIIKATPIDQPFGMHDPNSVGRARGGWVAGFDTNLNSNAYRLDPTGEATSRDAAANYALYSPRVHTTLYLVNTVGYIGKLEFGGYDFDNERRVKTLPSGFSFQAPYGMMRVNAKAWPSLVSNAARVARTVR
jgi:hypothetical protein